MFPTPQCRLGQQRVHPLQSAFRITLVLYRPMGLLLCRLSMLLSADPMTSGKLSCSAWRHANVAIGADRQLIGAGPVLLSLIT